MKAITKHIAHTLGFEIKRFSPASSHPLQLLKCLEFLNIDLVLDVGANKGQFGAELRGIGYRNRIVSFEPLSQVHEVLTAKARKDPLWEIYDRGAIGSEDGSVGINVSANSVSSSILPINAAHVDAAGKSEYVRQETVPIRRLDSIAQFIVSPADNIFIKIDTQGFEREVLAGAELLLKNVSGVLCELSIKTLYDGQPLWEDMVRFFTAAGFELWAIQTGFTNPDSGQTLQFDGIFVRRGD